MESKSIRTDLINPYDHIHFPTKEEWLKVEDYSQEHLINDYAAHLEGILWGISEFLKNGKNIHPILVTKVEGEKYKYQRRDGFKRYMVYKYLSLLFIPCYVATEIEALQLPQEGLFFIEGKNEQSI